MTKRNGHLAQTKPTAIPDEGLDRIPRLALTFTDETVWATRFDPRGAPVVTYPVAAVDVANAFNASTADSGLLPPDTLFWQRRKGESRLGVWLAPAVRKLVFATGKRTRTVKIPLPGFVFVGDGHDYSIFAAKEQPANGQAQLYHAPLPNVNDLGQICQGDAEFPKCSPDKIGGAVKAFFESNFNSHLSEGKIRSQRQNETEEEEPEYDEEDDYTFDGEGEELPEEDTDAYAIAHNGGRVPREQARTVRRAAPAVSLLTFLQGLKGKRSFPLPELVPCMTLSQLIAQRTQ